MKLGYATVVVGSDSADSASVGSVSVGSAPDRGGGDAAAEEQRDEREDGEDGERGAQAVEAGLRVLVDDGVGRLRDAGVVERLRGRRRR